MTRAKNKKNIMEGVLEVIRTLRIENDITATSSPSFKEVAKSLTILPRDEDGRTFMDLVALEKAISKYSRDIRIELEEEGTPVCPVTNKWYDNEPLFSGSTEASRKETVGKHAGFLLPGYTDDRAVNAYKAYKLWVFNTAFAKAFKQVPPMVKAASECKLPSGVPEDVFNKAIPAPQDVFNEVKQMKTGGLPPAEELKT